MDPFDLFFVLGFPAASAPAAAAFAVLAWFSRSRVVAVAGAVMAVAAIYEAITWSVWSTEAIRVDLVLLSPALLVILLVALVIGLNRLRVARGRPERWS